MCGSKEDVRGGEWGGALHSVNQFTYGKYYRTAVIQKYYGIKNKNKKTKAEVLQKEQCSVTQHCPQSSRKIRMARLGPIRRVPAAWSYREKDERQAGGSGSGSVWSNA